VFYTQVSHEKQKPVTTRNVVIAVVRTEDNTKQAHLETAC